MAALRVNLQKMNVCLVETSFYVCLQVVLMHQSWEATATSVFSWPSFHMIQPRCHQIPMQLRRSCPSLRDRSSRYDLTQTPLEDRIPHNSAYFLKPPAAQHTTKNCPSVPKAKYINIHTYMVTLLSLPRFMEIKIQTGSTEENVAVAWATCPVTWCLRSRWTMRRPGSSYCSRASCPQRALWRRSVGPDQMKIKNKNWASFTTGLKLWRFAHVIIAIHV